MSRRDPRLVAVVGCAAVFAIGLTACGGNDAATIGNTHITKPGFTRELAAIKHNSAYVARIEQLAGFPVRNTDGSLTAPFVAQVLTNAIRARVSGEIAEDHRGKLTHSQWLDARIVAVGNAGNPKIFGSFPLWYQHELIDRSVTVARLRRALAPMTPKQYYEQAKSAYVRACEWDIVTKTRDGAKRARARIAAGESFESVARDVSIDKGSGPRGGELACNERNNLVPELDDYAFTLRIGAVSQPIGAGEGDARVFHLLRVTKREIPPLAEIKGEIVRDLDKLGESKYESMMRSQLVSTDVRVAGVYGSWDKSTLIVLPPSVGPRTPIPTPRPRPLPRVATSSNQVDPSYQVGQQVFITKTGFRPLLLSAIVQEKITWINETTRAQSVRFVANGRKLGPIPPGGSVSYTPKTLGSIAFVLSGRPDDRAVVQVGWYYDPGEDPGAPNRLDADTPIPGTPTPRP